MQRIRDLEFALEEAFERRRAGFRYGVQHGRVVFERDIAARTEAHWYPIKQANRMKGTQGDDPDFIDFGDADRFRHKTQDLHIMTQ